MGPAKAQGPFGLTRSKKFFVEILPTYYLVGVHMGSSSGKTENSNDWKNDTPRGPVDPKNANFSTIEFRAEPPMFFIYILVVYEE